MKRALKLAVAGLLTLGAAACADDYGYGHRYDYGDGYYGRHDEHPDGYREGYWRSDPYDYHRRDGTGDRDREDDDD